MQISEYIHHCVVRYGPNKGNKLVRTVSHSDYENKVECPECGDYLVTDQQLLSHIYYELTK